MAIDKSVMTPEELEQYQNLIQEFGEGSRVVTSYEDRIARNGQQAPPLTPAPTMPGSVTSEEDIKDSAGAAYERRVQYYLSRGASPAQAKSAAKTDVTRIVNRSRTPEGASVYRPSTNKPLEDMSSSELFVEQFRPQVLVQPEMATEQRKARQSSAQIRSELEGQIRGDVLRMLGHPIASDTDKQFVDVNTHLKVLEFLSGYKQQLLDDAYTTALRDSGQSRQDLTKEEHRKIIESADAVFNAEVGAIFPDYVKGKYIEPSRENEQKWYQYLSFGGEQGTIGEALAKRAEAAFSEESGTGAIVESPAMVGMRAVGGYFRPAWETAVQSMSYDVDAEGNPIDPDDWNYRLSQEYDKMLEDWNSGDLSRSESRNRLEEMGITIGAMFSSELSRQTGARPMISTGNLLKDIMVSNIHGRFTGDDFMDMPATKKLYTDLGMPTAPFWIGLGTEIAVPTGPVGMAKGGLKLTGRGLSKAGAALSEVNRLETLLGIYGADDMARAAGEYATATSRGIDKALTFSVGDTARNYIRTTTLRRAYQKMLEESGGTVASFDDFVKGTSRFGLNDADEVLSQRLVAEFLKSKAASRGSTLSSKNPLIRAMIEDYRQIGAVFGDLGKRSADEVSRLINEGKISDDVVSAVIAELHKLAESDILPGLSRYFDDIARQLEKADFSKMSRFDAATRSQGIKNLLGANLASLGLSNDKSAETMFDILIKSGRKVSKKQAGSFSRSVQEEIQRAAAEALLIDKTKQRLANLVPNDMVFAAPYVLVRRGAYVRGLDKYEKLSQKILETSTVDGMHTFKNGEDVAHRIIRELGGKVAADNEQWHSILSKILRKQALSAPEYELSLGAARANIAREVYSSAFKATTRGPAAIRAAVPEVRQLTRFRDVQDVARAGLKGAESALTGRQIFSGFRKALRGADNFVYGFNKLSKQALPRLESYDMVMRLQALMANSGDVLKAELKSLRAGGMSKTAAMEEMMFRHSGIDKIPLDSDFKTHVEFLKNTYEEILKIFFNDPEHMVAIRPDILSDILDNMRVHPDVSPRINDVIDLIAEARRLDEKLIGKGLRGVNRGQDDVAAAIFTWMMRKMRMRDAEVIISDFAKAHPELLVSPPKYAATGNPFVDMFSRYLSADPSKTQKLLIEYAFTYGSSDPHATTRGIFDRIWRDMSVNEKRTILTTLADDTIKNATPEVNHWDNIITRSQAEIDRLSQSISKLESDIVDLTEQFKTTGDMAIGQKAWNSRRRLSQLQDTIRRQEKTIENAIEFRRDIKTRYNNAKRLKTQAGMANAIETPYHPDFKSYFTKIRNGFEEAMRTHAYDHQRMLNKMGLTPQTGQNASVAIPELVHVRSNATLMDTELAALYKRLASAETNGILAENLSALRIRNNPKTLNMVADTILHDLRVINRTAIGGMLGGFPLPNARFHFNNIFSAPFIASVTTPGYLRTAISTVPEAITTVIKGFSEAFPNVKTLDDISRWINDVQDVDHIRATFLRPTDVAFTDTFGKNWTRQMIDEALLRNEIGMSQAAFEFGDRSIFELERAAGIGASGQASGSAKQFWRYINPLDKNVWNIWAEEADKALRRNVFVTSLKRGLSESDAATLARNVLLDYGAITGAEKKLIARYAMFWSFQRQMAVETLASFGRPQGWENLVRQVRLSKALHDYAGTWTTEGDYAHSRLWNVWSKYTENERYKTLFAGQQIPALESMTWLSNMFDFVSNGTIQAMTGLAPGSDKQALSREILGDKLDIMLEGLRKKLLNSPAMATAYDIMTKYQTIPDSAPHGYLPAKTLIMWEELGAFDFAKDVFGLEVVPAGQEWPGSTTFNGHVWRFSDEGGRDAYKIYELVTTSAGLQRNIADYTRLLTKMLGSDDFDLKREGEGNWMLYSIALETPLQVPDELALQLELNYQINRELKGMAKK